MTHFQAYFRHENFPGTILLPESQYQSSWNSQTPYTFEINQIAINKAKKLRILNFPDKAQWTQQLKSKYFTFEQNFVRISWLFYQKSSALI